MSEGRNPFACVPACLLAACQLRNFMCEFTGKCFADLTNQIERFVSLSIGCSYFPGIFFYSIFGMALRF